MNALRHTFETKMDIELLVKCGHCEIVQEPAGNTLDTNKFKLNLGQLKAAKPPTSARDTKERSESPKTCILN